MLSARKRVTSYHFFCPSGLTGCTTERAKTSSILVNENQGLCTGQSAEGRDKTESAPRAEHNQKDKKLSRVQQREKTESVGRLDVLSKCACD